MTEHLLSVSQLNRYTKALLDENPLLSRVLVQGEISNLSDQNRSGHLYFSLKDAGASVRAVMFKSYAQQLRFHPRNGQKVVVNGSVTIYERDGQYQLYAYDLQPDGAGALALAFEQLKERLGREGLFAPERKRALPRIPQCVGIVTSPTGAALQDMLNVLGRRFPALQVVVAPVQVQGAEAPEQIVSAIRALGRLPNCDVIVLARGGGSAEDLAAFNEELVARAVFASGIPVVSAVGHETDFTIADFVADVRAPTPSAAAELVAPEQEELRAELLAAERHLHRIFRASLSEMEQKLALGRSGLRFHHPETKLGAYRERLAFARMRLKSQMERQLENYVQDLGERLNLLESLSPLSVLARGYSIARRQGRTLINSSQIQPGESFDLWLAHGRLTAQVVEKAEDASL